MTWAAFHRRGEVLRNVIEAADLRRDGALPMDVPGVAETFGDELALVAALQLRWHTRLAGTIERELMDRPGDPETAVVAAWCRSAADLAGIRAVLDVQAAAPRSIEIREALIRANRNDWALMAAMAGQAGPGDHRAVAAGHALEQKARAACLVA